MSTAFQAILKMATLMAMENIPGKMAVAMMDFEKKVNLMAKACTVKNWLASGIA